MINKIITKELSLAKVEMGLTIDKTLNQPTCRSVFKGDNAVVGFTFVNVLITRFLNSFGFSTKFTPDQIEMLTVDTLDVFSYETVPDIILFLKMARSGKFGETQRGVDSNLIYGKWFPMYLEKKSELREKKHNTLKESEKLKNTISMEDVEITYRKRMKIKEDLARKQYNEKHILDFTKNMDRQMLEDTINSWNKDEKLKNHVTMLKLQRRVIKE